MINVVFDREAQQILLSTQTLFSLLLVLIYHEVVYPVKVNDIPHLSAVDLSDLFQC